MQLSVVIPVYNVKKYLHIAVQSVLFQDIEDMEIILVDDGSTDGSGKCCDELALRYPCIRVIHQQNGGLSSARNTGIKAAKGDYLMFLDSDDWWNPDVKVNEILDIAHTRPSIQMFLLSGYDYYEGDGLYIRKDAEMLGKIDTSGGKQYYESLMKYANYQMSPATKVFRRSFIIDNDLFFEAGITGEDNRWMMLVLRKLRYVQVLNVLLHVYRRNREGSITSSIKRKNIEDLLGIIKTSQFEIEQGAVPKEIQDCEKSFCAYLWFCALGLVRKISAKDRETLYPLFQETADVCRYSYARKTKLAYVTYRVFGIRIVSWVFGTYISLNGKHKLNQMRVSDGSDYCFYTDV